MLDMTLLQRLVDQAGIRAKHQLFILDCCYSGVAPRDGFEDLLRNATGWTDEYQLNHKAQFILSAGAPTQPVFDGGETGHGLLSGALIRTFGDPTRLAKDARAVYGRRHVRMLDLLSDLGDMVQRSALDLIDPSNRAATAPRQLLVRDPRGLDHFVRGDSGDLKDHLVSQGRIPFPQLNSAQQAAQLLIPIEPPPRSVIPPRPGTADPPAIPLADWAGRVAERYALPEYGTNLTRLFELIANGQPSRTPAGNGLAVEGEVYVRANVTDEMAGIAAIENDAKRWHERELAQLRNPKWDWHRVRQSGECILEGEWLRIRVDNAGDVPFYYYFLALDQEGILQWLAPENTSAGLRSSDFTFGPRQLQPGEALRIPGLFSRDVPGEGFVQFPDSWSVEGSFDLQLILVVTRTPWTELEDLLQRVSAQGFELQANNAPARTRGEADLALPLFRALSPRQSRLLASSGLATQGAGAGPAVVTRTEADLLVETWKLDVVARMAP
jgi:hypothetical protein